MGVNHNLVEKSGAWFSYKGERIGQGRENSKAFLKENKDICAKLDAELRKHLGLSTAAEKAAAAAANGQPAMEAQPKGPVGRK